MGSNHKIIEISYYHDPDKTGIPYESIDDEEVCVRLQDGRKFYCWFFTREKIKQLMIRHRLSGESNRGSYFWVSGMIIIDSISKKCMEESLLHMIEVEGD
ncbi:MAG: hypothetical protein AAFR97_08195, partial [Bacteroidota bacterium]